MWGSDSRKKREYDSCAGSCGSGEDDGDEVGDDESEEDGEGDGDGEGNMMAILWPELGRGMPHILKCIDM